MQTIADKIGEYLESGAIQGRIQVAYKNVNCPETPHMEVRGLFFVWYVCATR